jgi:hypothetical protein
VLIFHHALPALTTVADNVSRFYRLLSSCTFPASCVGVVDVSKSAEALKLCALIKDVLTSRNIQEEFSILHRSCNPKRLHVDGKHNAHNVLYLIALVYL